MKDEIKLVIIDRDGTLIFDKHYLSDINDVELIPGTISGLSKLHNNNILIALHTNQSGIERGYFNLEVVENINNKMFELIGGLEKKIFSDICIAPNIISNNENYRKPSPKFANELMHKYNLDSKSIAYIGDTLKDKECANNIKSSFFWLAYQKKEKLDCKPYMNLEDIANEIIN